MARIKGQRNVRPIPYDVDNSGDEIGWDSVDEDDAVGDISTILKEHQERQAKKASVRASARQTQKKSIYASARKTAKDVSRTGIEYLENAIGRIQELKDQEDSAEKAFGDFEHLLSVQEDLSKSLLALYAPFVNDLATRRSEEVNAASEMQRRNPSKREAALLRFSKRARAHVEEARQNEKVRIEAA
ncbi:hypothetical protein H0H93_013970 [Arthromyces matolae]|nr:hypothetical protein H0H93_013970 [Arthromyces matolae]